MTNSIGNNLQAKGYLFEVIVRFFLANNGWHVIQHAEEERVLVHNNYKIEIRGRGIYHQIDSPCLFDHAVPFIYPPRLIVEAKFYKRGVHKEHIRPFIGLMKDISENYFAPFQTMETVHKRYTDVGAVFSATGFHKEAINLAFAHGIMTISYHANPLMLGIKQRIQSLSDRQFPNRSRVEDAGGQFVFMNDFERFLKGEMEASIFFSKYELSSEQETLTRELFAELTKVRASFMGTTSSGVFLHFIGNEDFPDKLFSQTDIQPCRIFFMQELKTSEIGMWLEFSEDMRKRRYYFDVPPGLEDAIRKNRGILTAKEHNLASITVIRRIMGITRSLVIQLDMNWLDELKERKRNLG
jgi:hypothetical protein